MIKLKYINALILVVLSVYCANAQYSPQAGDVVFGIKYGQGVTFSDLEFSEVNSGMSPINSLPGNGVEITETTLGVYSLGDATSTLGVDIKFFITDFLALRINGGGLFGGSPSRDYVEGVSDPDGINYPGTYIPGYIMFEGRAKQSYFLDFGSDFYFASKYDRVAPYAGLQFNGLYSQLVVFDGYRGLDAAREVRPTYDDRKGEAYALGGSLVAGVDYFLTEALIVGVEFKAVNYMYSVKSIFHQTGLNAQSVDAHTTSFLAQPAIKIGIRF